MRHSSLKAFIVASLLVVPVVNAQEYPAADFQPKVVFRDESIVVAPTPAAAPSAPAATPCINSQAVAVAAKPEASEFDPKYPASSFQPKVIFSQAN
jgi:hypothetical protein